MYDAVCVILYQILRAVTCLELFMDSITGFIIKKYYYKKISKGQKSTIIASNQYQSNTLTFLCIR